MERTAAKLWPASKKLKKLEELEELEEKEGKLETELNQYKDHFHKSVNSNVRNIVNAGAEKRARPVALTLEDFLKMLKITPQILDNETAKKYYNMFPDDNEEFKTLLTNYKDQINNIMTLSRPQPRRHFSEIAKRYTNFQELVQEFENK